MYQHLFYHSLSEGYSVVSSLALFQLNEYTSFWAHIRFHFPGITVQKHSCWKSKMNSDNTNTKQNKNKRDGSQKEISNKHIKKSIVKNLFIYDFNCIFSNSLKYPPPKTNSYALLYSLLSSTLPANRSRPHSEWLHCSLQWPPSSFLLSQFFHS